MFLDSDLGTLNLVVETYKRRNPAEVGNIKFWPTIWNLNRASLSEKMARLHDFGLFTLIK